MLGSLEETENQNRTKKNKGSPNSPERLFSRLAQCCCLTVPLCKVYT